MKSFALLAGLALAAVLPQDAPTPTMPAPASPDANHEWLQQLVGEWAVTAEMTMEPGAEPMQMESTESVRAVGELWIVGEGSASFGGMPFTSILTLGYDPREEAFVGTWIDSMQPNMWTYRGTLDEARKILTLETEGPSFGDTTETATYRDAIELVSADHKVLTSSVRGEDGTWTTFLRADYRRKK
jgi:hypothetical protein